MSRDLSPVPLPYASRAGGRPGWLAVLAWSLFRPGQLGQRWPEDPDDTGARVYSTVMRIVAAIAFTLLLSIPNSMNGAHVFAAGAAAFVVVSILCELGLTALLTSLVEPVDVPAEVRWRFWRTLCHAFSTHFLLTLGLISGLTFAVAWAGFDRQRLPLVFVVVPLLMVLWWWFCLGQAVMARSRPSSRRTAVVFVIPLAGAVSVALAAGAFLLIINLLN